MYFRRTPFVHHISDPARRHVLICPPPHALGHGALQHGFHNSSMVILVVGLRIDSPS